MSSTSSRPLFLYLSASLCISPLNHSQQSKQNLPPLLYFDYIMMVIHMQVGIYMICHPYHLIVFVDYLYNHIYKTINMYCFIYICIYGCCTIFVHTNTLQYNTFKRLCRLPFLLKMFFSFQRLIFINSISLLI